MGDVILKVNEVEVSTSPELQGAIAQYRPGETVDIHLNRSGKEISLEVKLHSRNGHTEDMSKEAGHLLKILGAKMNDISNQERK